MNVPTQRGVHYRNLYYPKKRILYQRFFYEFSRAILTLPNGVRIARENCNKLRVKAKVTNDK